MDLYRKKLKEAWLRFMESGNIDESVVRREIADQWKRCKAYGLDPYGRYPIFTRDLDDKEKKDVFT